MPPSARASRQTRADVADDQGRPANNLQNVTASIPLGTFICVTGVSGSGKSTLIIETLYKALASG